VRGIAQSLWRMKLANRIFTGEATVQITRGRLDRLAGEPNALAMLLKFEMDHAARGRPFAAPPKKLAEIQYIPGWGHQRYRDALETLVRLGDLQRVRKGGKCGGDPHLYAFGNPASEGGRQGTKPGPNVILHPLLAPPPAFEVKEKTPVGDRPHNACKPSRHRTTPSMVTDTVPLLADALPDPVGATSTSGDTLSAAVVGGDGQLDLIEFIGGPPAPRRAADPRAFGAALREARTRLQLSQKTAARMAGLSRSGFGNIETGEYPPSPETVSRLAEVFGVRLAS
jgi:DNA-binding XRE family transcriptional regulator